MNDDLQSLFSSVCDNRATEEELARLSRLLREDQEVQDLFLKYVDIHAALADEALPVIESNIINYASKSAVVKSLGIGYSKWLLASAASIAILLGLGALASYSFIANQSGNSSPHPYLQATPIATMLLAENCQWLEKSVREGQRLEAGRISLEFGTAVLRFDGGAELVLIGPSEIDLQTPSRVQLNHGDVVVRATSGAEGFVVNTPISQVIDLGTEFAVKVSHSGATEVHVLDGEVSYRGTTTADELSKILRAGEGIAIDEYGRPRAVPMNSPRFLEFVNRINPQSRSDLLTAYEGFNYSPGILPLEKSTVGIGWKGPWRHPHPRQGLMSGNDLSSDNFDIVHGEINVAWPVPGGRLGMLKLPSTSTTYVREFEHPINLDSDNVTYFSLMTQINEPSDIAAGESTTQHADAERMYLTFGSSDHFAKAHITFGYAGNFIPFIQLSGGSKFDSPVQVPQSQTSLWIGKIVSRRDGDNEVYLRVYNESDVLDFAEPTAWHVVSRKVRLGGELDRIVLHSQGRSSRIIDELRIGPTWRSVAPIASDATQETQE
ncbi:FecR domain-containing protein [Bremerella sp. T1]|uniref:FecR domain-containing protein n=1 Tax=Bremerella sp. TYQ1 TaxID=3119568 RepID=UPI001CCF1460|nr:FecR domain-containing protein [Bremerella volcania]UBM36703.1 FecR family protein [Bremerella volcania]